MGYWRTRALAAATSPPVCVPTWQAGGVVEPLTDGSPLQLSEGRLIASASASPTLMAGLPNAGPLPGACYGIPGPEAEPDEVA